MKKLALSGFLALTACASIDPALGHRALALDVERRLGVSTGWNQGRPEDAQVEQRLDALLAAPLDPQAAVAIALLNNGALQATYEELGIAQADLVQAGLLKNPVLSFSLGIPVGPANVAEGELNLVQSFLDLFMLPLRKKVARAQFDAAVLRVTHETLEEAAAVTGLFADYVTAQQRLKLARTGAEGFGATALLAQRQREAGNITAYRLATEEAAAAQARFAATRAEVDVATLREALQQHLGLSGPRTGWSAIASLPEPPQDAPPLEHLEQRAVAQRLDLEQARQELALADQALALARTFRFVGAFDLGVHAHQDPDGARLLGPTLQLELPIFDQRQALLARLEAQQARAEHQLRARAVAVRSQVRLAFTRMDASSRLAEDAQRRLVPLRAQAVAEAQRLYNGMLIGLYELMAARQADLEAQHTALEARRDYWVARAELVRALGGRWTSTSSSPGAPHE